MQIINKLRPVAFSLAAIAASTATMNVSVGQDTMMKDSHGVMKHADDNMMKTDTMSAPVGLDGYCPVCVVEHGKWEKGRADIQSVFDGIAYQFPTESIQKIFDANPQKYVPVLGGDCIVCLENAGKRVPGSVQHAALHNQRLYLFPSDAEKKQFMDNPKAYWQTDLAVDGECIVCLAKAGKHVPGTRKHTVIHDGLRYQFPSENEAGMFRQSPDQFLSKVSMTMDADTAVQLVGRSGCAACEFGVTPLSNPDELGLAVVGKDGKITVIEGAHQAYPEIYEERFAGKQLAVEGKIVKTDGKVRWLQPSSLRFVN